MTEPSKHCLIEGGEVPGVAYRIDGTYPVLTKIFPKRKDLKNQIFAPAFDANQVAKFCLKKDKNHLTLWQAEKDSVIFVSNRDERFTGFLMPSRPEIDISSKAILNDD